jgi:hypothetical protein
VTRKPESIEKECIYSMMLGISLKEGRRLDPVRANIDAKQEPAEPPDRAGKWGRRFPTVDLYLTEIAISEAMAR